MDHTKQSSDMKLSTKFLPLMMAALFMISCDKEEPVAESEISASPMSEDWSPTYEIGHVLTKQEAIDAGIDVSRYYDNWNPIEAEALPEGIEKITQRSVGPHRLRADLKKARNLYWYQANSSGQLVFQYQDNAKVFTIDVPQTTWYNCVVDYTPMNRWEIVNPANSNFQAILGYWDELQQCWTPTASGLFSGWNDEFAALPGGLTSTCGVQRVYFSSACP